MLQSQVMKGVEFEIDQLPRKKLTVLPRNGFITQFIISKSNGIIRTAGQAQFVEILFIIVAALFLIYTISSSHTSIKAPSRELINSPQPIQPL